MLGKFIIRETRRRPGRALLTLLSIAIGTAAVVSVSLGTRATREASRQMYEALSGRAALEVVAQGNGDFDQSLAATLETIPGVKAAVPSVQRFTILRYRQERVTVFMLGIDPQRDRLARDYELREGRFFEDGRGALLEASFAAGAGIELGDEVSLQTPRGGLGLKRVKVVGLLEPRGVAGFKGGGAIFLPLGIAERYFSRPGQVNTIDLVLDKSADEQAVMAEVERQLPVGLRIHPSADRSQFAQETMVNIEAGLRFASTLTGVLAIFVIANTFLMNVSERRKQLAILRAIGATRGQVVRMVMLEALILGTAGTALGCVGGVAGGAVLLRAMAQMFSDSSLTMTYAPAPFLLAALLGPLVAVAAAYVPARTTTRISPMEAMRPLVAQDGGRVSPSLIITGLVLSALAGVLLVGSIVGWVSAAFSIPAGAAFLGTSVLWLWILVRPLARLVLWLLWPLLRMEVRLAHRQVLRRPTRTTLTIGVLFIAVGTGIGVGTTIVNNIEDVRNWLRRTLPGDFFVRAMFSDVDTGLTAELSAALGDEIRQIPGVTNIDSVRFVNARAEGRPVVIVAGEFSDPQYLPVDLYQARSEEVYQRILQGEVVIGTALAQRSGVKVGDQLTLETKDGPRKLRVAGLAVDYTVGGQVVFMQQKLAQELFQVEGVDTFLIRARPDARAEVGERLAAFCREHGMMLHSFAELIQMLDAIMSKVVAGLWAVLVLGFVVAAFGIANTVTMNVLEQTRELAMLRVVAMTRRQVRRMVLGQAAIIGLIGLGLGTFAGVNTAYTISLSTMPLLGHPVPMVIHFWLLAGAFAVGLVLVLAAAWLPAERAARLNLLVALNYE